MAELPQEVPAIVAGSTESSTLVTVNGALVGVPALGEALDVGVEALPLPPPLVPHADTATASRQQRRIAGQRAPLWVREYRRWRARDRTIVVSPV
jgi:hypothetical protein